MCGVSPSTRRDGKPSPPEHGLQWAPRLLSKPCLAAGRACRAAHTPGPLSSPPDSLAPAPKPRHLAAKIKHSRRPSHRGWNVLSCPGARCEHCHVGEGGPALGNMTFAADDKETKRTARLMMRKV